MGKRLLVTIVSAALIVVVSVPAAAQVPPEVPDPEGDTTDFGGNPADGPDLLGVIAVEVTEHEGFDAFELFGVIFDLDPAPGFIDIRPDEPGPLLRGSGPLILVTARLSRSLPDAEYCQIVVAFKTEGLEQYSGAAGDPNNGNDTTLDAFRQSGEWMRGRTEYRAGDFSFISDYNEIAATIGEDTIAIVFPREAIPDGAMWQIWVICGDDAVSAGRDFTDLGSFLPGIVPTASIIPPTTTVAPTTTTTTATATQPTAATTTAVAPETTVGATETTPADSDSGGGFPLGILIVAVAAVGGLVGYFLFRKRKGPCDCDEEKAAYDAAQARYAEAESDLNAARQLVDDWRGRQSEASSAIVALDALRPRRQEFSDQAEFDAASAEYQRRRAELEADAAELEAELAQAEARVPELERQAQERWDESQAMLAILKACWQRCFDAPYDVGSTSTRPGATGESGGGAEGGPGGEDGDGDDPRDTPPPDDAECTSGDTQEEVTRTGTFTVLVDGMIRVSLSTDRGPLDDLNDIVSGNPVADTIAEFLGPDGTLEFAPGSLSGANAQRWQEAIEDMRALTFGLLKREIYVNLVFDVEDVTVDCIRMDRCQGGRWVTAGHRSEETSRVARSVSYTWVESESGGRPFGATMTEVNRDIAKAEDGRRAWQEFLAKCT